MAKKKGKLKAAIKKTSTKVKAKGKKVKEKVKAKAKKALKKTGFVPLIPLKPAMVTVLKLRKVPVKMTDKIDKVAMLFADVVIKGKQSLEYKHYEVLNHLPLMRHENLVEDVASIIKMILEWFKKKQDDKKAGKKISEEEEAALLEAEKSEKENKKKKGFFARLWERFFGSRD